MHFANLEAPPTWFVLTRPPEFDATIRRYEIERDALDPDVQNFVEPDRLSDDQWIGEKELIERIAEEANRRNWIESESEEEEESDMSRPTKKRRRRARRPWGSDWRAKKPRRRRARRRSELRKRNGAWRRPGPKTKKGSGCGREAKRKLLLLRRRLRSRKKSHAGRGRDAVAARRPRPVAAPKRRSPTKRPGTSGSRPGTAVSRRSPGNEDDRSRAETGSAQAGRLTPRSSGAGA